MEGALISPGLTRLGLRELKLSQDRTLSPESLFSTASLYILFITLKRGQVTTNHDGLARLGPAGRIRELTSNNEEV